MKYKYGSLTVHQLPVLQDNYAFILRDKEKGITACVDTPDAKAITAFLDQQGWGLDYILNTHWHYDHVGGNLALKEHFCAKIIGPAGEDGRIPGLDQAVIEGAQISIGDTIFRVIETPGHTKGHIIYVSNQEDVAFVGDTLFSLGCGRLFEGTPAQMWDSLCRVRALSPDIMIHCAHEYTADLVRFALSVDGDNPHILARAKIVTQLRRQGLPTVPMRLSDECRENPFLRADDLAFARALGRESASAAEVFAEIRQRKDRF